MISVYLVYELSRQSTLGMQQQVVSYVRALRSSDIHTQRTNALETPLPSLLLL